MCMEYKHQYMVEFNLPEDLTDDFLELIPLQRNIIHTLLAEGILVNYAISLQNSRLWAVINADSEEEVEEILADWPLLPYLEGSIHLLTFYKSKEETQPAFSLN